MEHDMETLAGSLCALAVSVIGLGVFLSINRDEREARRRRRKLGIEGFIVSWEHDPHKGRWIAKLSRWDRDDDTLEREGDTRNHAIDKALATADILWK